MAGMKLGDGLGRILQCVIIRICGRVLAAVLLSAAALSAFAETYSWTGGGGLVDWTRTDMWKSSAGTTGVLPGPTDTVLFTAAPTYADFTVTPPADFAGTIKAMGNAPYDETGLVQKYLPARVKIVNANEAAFTIGGVGVLEAFPGIETMLDPAFESVIDIPSGVTLEPPADFAVGASFMGVGVLKPSTALQVERASAFRGTLDLRNLGAFEFGNDASLLMGRKAILGAGTTVAPNKQTTTLAPLDLSADDWTFNSGLSAEGCVPSLDETGVLTLPHVQGVQNRTSAFLNRRFKVDESFCIRFKLDIKAGNGACGFGIVMRKGELTDVASGLRTVEANSIPDNSHGVTTLYYNNSVRFNLFERLSGQNKFQTWGSWQFYQQDAEAGFTLRNGSPIDVVASCHNGVFSITFTQDGATRTFRQGVSALYSDSRGAMFGFIAHENNQETSTVSLEVKASEFEGWVASDRNGQWMADPSGDFTLNADNYQLYLDYKENGVIKSFRGNDALDAEGRVRVCEGGSWMGAAVSKKSIPNTRFRLEWKNDLGTASNKGEHTDVGFSGLGGSGDYLKGKFGDYEHADGSGYGATDRQYLSAGDPIKFCAYWYGSLFGLTKNWQPGTQEAHYTGTYVVSAAYGTANSTNEGKWFYDGSGFHTVRYVNSSENASRTFTLAGQSLGSSRNLAITGAGNPSETWSCYQKNWLGGIRMSYWDPGYAAAACLDVAAPAGVTTTMPGLGTYAPIARVELEDAVARLEFTGTVAFGERLDIVVPDDFLKEVRTQATLVDLSAASVDGSLPTAVRLVDAAGTEVALRGRALKITAAGVVLGEPVGLMVIVR